MKINNNVIVSVAICTYNCEKYIGQQIKSILEQDCSVDEIVLGDDCSKDHTVEIAENELKNGNVKYKILRNKTTLGYRKNFENTIAHTTGDIIFLSDQDDVWKKNKVSVMIKHFIEDPKCLLVFSDADLVDSELNVQKESLWDAVLFNCNRTEESNFRKLFLKGGYVTGAAMAIRKTLFERAYPFSELCVHDAWLAMCAALQDGIVSEPEKLFMYRQHTSNQIGVPYSRKKKLETKLKAIKEISKQQKLEHKNKELIYAEMYTRFYEWIVGDIVFESDIQNCIKFHAEMKNIDSLSMKKRVQTLYKNFIAGNYNKFTKTRGSLISDIVVAIFK